MTEQAAPLAPLRQRDAAEVVAVDVRVPVVLRDPAR